MLKGGYQIVDLKDKDIDTDGSNLTVPAGTHASIANSKRKPLLLSGIVLDSVEYNDLAIEVTKSGTSYVFVAYGYTWTISNIDGLTLVALS